MEIVDIPVTEKENLMSIVNGTAFNVCLLKISDYHQTDSLVRTVQIEDPYIPLRNASLSHVT